MGNKLKLEQLACYLPYGLKFIYNDAPIKINEWELVSLGKRANSNEFVALATRADYKNQIHTTIELIKPILRPLSDLTNEIEHNGEKFVPKDILYKNHCGLEFDKDFEVDTYSSGEGGHNSYSLWEGYDVIQKLISWHFDIFGLIDAGLAIDINTL